MFLLWYYTENPCFLLYFSLLVIVLRGGQGWSPSELVILNWNTWQGTLRCWLSVTSIWGVWIQSSFPTLRYFLPVTEPPLMTASQMPVLFSSFWLLTACHWLWNAGSTSWLPVLSHRYHICFEFTASPSMQEHLSVKFVALSQVWCFWTLNLFHRQVHIYSSLV